MRYNTNIDFIQPSGGDINDISYIKLLPLDADREGALSSGSVWLRPNDGQMERLVVQGTDKLLEVKNAQGYGYYSTTTIRSLANGATGLMSGFNIIVQDDPFVVLSDVETVTVQVSGLYRIDYNVSYFSFTAGNNSDGSVFARLLINETKLDGAETTSYIPATGDGGACNCAFRGMAILDRGDRLQIEVGQLQTLSNLNATTGRFGIELLRPKGILS